MIPPKVFISYSHDGPEHKQWVEDLAIRLRKQGIDTTLDQWDLAPGDDVALFMERGLTECDRVLVICTDTYVSKAEAGTGGVGYERMILTAELVRNISTKKFIPIIRNANPGHRSPVFLATRAYIDFSDDAQLNTNFEQLSRELHQQPPSRKPPLGKSPFAISTLGEELVKSPQQLTTIELSKEATASDSYTSARRILLADQKSEWDLLVRRLVASTSARLISWRQTNEQIAMQTAEQQGAVFDGAIEAMAPLFSAVLAAVESGRKEFRDQSGLVHDLLNLRNWNQSGRTWFVDAPNSLIYVLHNLHGAISVSTGQFDVALKFVDRKVRVHGTSDFLRICQQHQLLGWPQAIGGNSMHGWIYIFSAYDRWKWMPTIFQTADEFHESLITYWMLLNINELVLALADKAKVDFSNPEGTRLDVPLQFAIGSREANRRAFTRLLQNPDQIHQIWKGRGISRNDVEANWSAWIKCCEYWLHRSGDQWGFSTLEHRDLFKAL